MTSLRNIPGDYWAVGYGERVFRLKDCLGLSFISYLLGHSGTEFHVLDTKARRASLATIAALLLTAAGARAQEHVSGFAHLSEPQSTTQLEDWGPVPTDKESIANLAPC